jgi:hypothetical protein
MGEPLLLPQSHGRRPGIPSFAEHFEYAKARNHLVPDHYLNLDDRSDLPHLMICSTRNFYVIIGLGSFWDFYLLIVTKDGYMSMAQLPEELMDELDLLTQTMNHVLLDRPRRSSMVLNFEHGTGNVDCTAACCTQENAHLHLKSLDSIDHESMQTGLREAIRSRRINLPLKFQDVSRGEFDVLPRLRKIIDGRKSYIFLRTLSNKIGKDFCVTGQVPDGTSPSQLLRQACYLAMPKEERKGASWDWQLDHGGERLKKRNLTSWLAICLYEKTSRYGKTDKHLDSYAFQNHFQLRY